MARKKIIVREIKPEFTEIKKQEKKEIIEEENLEEEIGDFEEIMDFSSKTTTPVLQSQPLEQVLENVPSTASKKEEELKKETGYESSIYNMPDYTGSYEETGVKRRDMKETGIIIRPEDIREKLPRARAEEWHEISEMRQAGEAGMEHAVTKAERLDSEKKLPFEEKRKYRKIT
jgi:hypothetical protein